MRKKLVAYFSASGNTEKVAKDMAKAAEADLFKIKPVIPYTETDLNWMNKNSRSSVEMNQPDFRPEIQEKLQNMDQYDTVILMFPIWWYIAPTIINTFLESYDLSGKTIVVYATSGGSGMGNTVEKLKGSVAADTKLIEGRILSTNVSVNQLRQALSNI